MQIHHVFAAAVLAAVLAPLGAAEPVDAPAVEADSSVACAAAPPCGPITVIITIVLEKSRDLQFGDTDVFETKGKVSYYFDVDGEGYWYDAGEEVWLEFAVNKQPPWLETSFEPKKIKVPYRAIDGCTDCVRQEGSDPQQWQFYWEGDVKVKVEKLRDYDAAELKKWLKSDGTYRVTFRASSNDSMAGTDATGRPAGLMEGYGPKDLRFRPEVEGASAETNEADGLAAGPGLLVFLFAAVGAIGLRFRRA
ncbi:MAG: hypothetical protein HYT80_06945 [Euryarchaeota archaeon]|nr:hypothetical protein [Euryarchaeota archaeon]